MKRSMAGYVLLAVSISVIISCNRSGTETAHSLAAGADTAGVEWGRPAVLSAGEGELRMLQGRKPLLIKVDPMTQGSRTLTVGLEDMPPGDSIGIHKHLSEDEVVFVHRGEVEVTLGDAQYRAQAGATVFIPRNTWIGFRVLGPDTATVFFVFNTPGFEKCLRAFSAPAGEPFVRPTEAAVAAARQECHQVRKAEVVQ